MPVTKEFVGQLTDRVASEVVPNWGVKGAPLMAASTNFSNESNDPNSVAIVSLMLHNSKGRTAQKLGKVDPDNSNIKSPDYRVYSDYMNPSTAAGQPDANGKQRPGFSAGARRNSLTRRGI